MAEDRSQQYRGPCPAALGAFGVPARRWVTRAELYVQLDKAKTFLDYCDLDASLADAARAADISVHHFLRLFHEVHGQTPHQYLTHRRMTVAQRLLRESTMSIAEIAVETGFESASAFGRLFRRHTGQTPKSFRKGEAFARSDARQAGAMPGV